MTINKNKFECSLNDTTILRNLILENPDLPLLIFCGENSWHDEYPYEQVDVNSGCIKEVTLYNNYWLDREEYEEELINNLSDQEEYKDLSDEEYDQMIDQKVVETESVKVIIIYVG